MKAGKWERRIRRAQELAATYPYASEGLLFYEKIARFQQSMYAEAETARGKSKKTGFAGTLRQELDAIFLVPRFAPFLYHIERYAPPPLAKSARELHAQDAKRWEEVLREFWGEGPNFEENLRPAEALFACMFLQPYAECIAANTDWALPAGTPRMCPLCGTKPIVGVLRPEGDGGKRSLICALCSAEWEFRRIVCPACGEEDVHKLAVFSAQELGHVRVEACDTCHSYIKTVDLTKSGHAVPVVDELASIPLNVWAGEHGYTKLQANILGI
jgi:FdhE protein